MVLRIKIMIEVCKDGRRAKLLKYDYMDNKYGEYN
jgi:hypothetical protein